jgi:hypothetical protein
MTFEELKQAVETSYLESFPPEWFKEDAVDLYELSQMFSEAKTLNELVDLLDGLGFNKPHEHYGFIIDSILED